MCGNLENDKNEKENTANLAFCDIEVNVKPRRIQTEIFCTGNLRRKCQYQKQHYQRALTTTNITTFADFASFAKETNFSGKTNERTNIKQNNVNEKRQTTNDKTSGEKCMSVNQTSGFLKRQQIVQSKREKHNERRTTHTHSN